MAEDAKVAAERSRAPKIYTKVGDAGFTSLLGASARVPKWDRRVKAYGAIDELNAYLGQVAEVIADIGPASQADSNQLTMRTKLSEDTIDIQRTLFLISSWMACADYLKGSPHLAAIDPATITRLESRIDEMTAPLPALKNFILQRGEGTCFIHIARTICRRAEYKTARAIHEQYADEVPVYNTILQFMNRLSDWLFTLARYHTFTTEQREIRA